MRNLYFTLIAIFNLAVLRLSAGDYLRLRDIRANLYQLTHRLHGPMDESDQLPRPRTMQELHLHYQRVITTRWNITQETLNQYAALHRTTRVHTGIALLLVASSFLSFLLVSSPKQKTQKDGAAGT